MGLHDRPDVDLMDGGFFGGDPYPAFAWMREHEPVFRDEANSLWALASHALVKTASTDTTTFSSAGGIRPKFPPLPMMIDFDSPEHVRRRRLVSSGFSPRRVRELEDHVRALTDEILDEVCEAGHADFVSDIAARLPLAVIGDLLGVAPADRDDLLRWSETMLRSQGDLRDQAIVDASEAYGEYVAYLEPVLEQRRESAASEDLIGALVNAEWEDDRLDHDSVLHESLLILVGGDETTRHVISGGLDALLSEPAQFAAFRADRTLLPSAVEEMVRWISPIQNMARTVTRDVTFDGTLIHQGDEVLLLYPSANRDRAVFDDPDTFDIRRTPNPHLGFGFGAHFCLGNQLARLELRVLFDRLLDRLPDIALDTPGPFPRRASNFITGYESMPVSFTPTEPIVVGGTH